MPAPHGLIERLAEMAAAGKPFVLVTLAEAVGSTPQDAGTKMLVDATGLRFGTVGGGKVEQQAIAAAQTLLANPTAQPCTLVEWNLKRDVGMTCGGTVKLLFEAYHLHPWRVVVFGSRSEWLDRLPASANIDKVLLAEPRNYVPRLSAADFVVCMTMGHASDFPILEAIFKAGLETAYLGVIGSRAKREVLRKELEAAGVHAGAIERLRCPIGLPIGGNQPGEIAVSLAAEILQVRSTRAEAAS
jgi:xanthine dehydrogenase accessory factor